MGITEIQSDKKRKIHDFEENSLINFGQEYEIQVKQCDDKYKQNPPLRQTCIDVYKNIYSFAQLNAKLTPDQIRNLHGRLNKFILNNYYLNQGGLNIGHIHAIIKYIIGKKYEPLRDVAKLYLMTNKEMLKNVFTDQLRLSKIFSSFKTLEKNFALNKMFFLTIKFTVICHL
jgi:hypothetical protein